MNFAVLIHMMLVSVIFCLYRFGFLIHEGKQKLGNHRVIVIVS